MGKQNVAAWMMVALTMAGCAGNRDAVLKAATPSRQDVFQEQGSDRAETGPSLLHIEFPVKTYKARLGSRYIKHSNPQYTMLVNIDGQVVEVTDEPVLEHVQEDFTKNPEAGTGWKYVFRSTVQLAAGSHRIAIAVPQSGIVVEKNLTLKEGENSLHLSPLYNSCVSHFSSYPRFSHGYRGIALNLNSKQL